MSDGVEELGPGRASPASRRPRWSQADRLRIIAESYRPKVSVVARHNDVNANLRFSPGGGGFASRLGDPVGWCRYLWSRPGRRRPGRMPRGRCTGCGTHRDRAGGRLGAGPGSGGSGAAMIPIPGGVRVWLATGVTDMRRGMNTLALQVQEDLGRDPHAGDLYIFRGRRGDLVKCLWHAGRYLASFAWRYNRRYQLQTMIPRFVHSAARTQPMPYRLLIVG